MRWRPAPILLLVALHVAGLVLLSQGRTIRETPGDHAPAEGPGWSHAVQGGAWPPPGESRVSAGGGGDPGLPFTDGQR